MASDAYARRKRSAPMKGLSRLLPAPQDDGRRLQENAPAVGQPRDARAITERLREINWSR